MSEDLLTSAQRTSGLNRTTGAEMLLTEMKDDELLELVKLDLNKALKES